MTFTELTVYRCDKCNKLYTHLPRECSCNGKIAKDNFVGPFKILEQEDADNWKVSCRLCDMIKIIHRTNIRRSTSCGCKPRHIHVLTLAEKQIRYKCDRCRTITSTNYPVIDWCCTDE